MNWRRSPEGTFWVKLLPSPSSYSLLHICIESLHSHDWTTKCSCCRRDDVNAQAEKDKEDRTMNSDMHRWNSFLNKLVIPGLVFIYFSLFKQTLPYVQQYNVKNIHLVSSPGIGTHDLLMQVSSIATRSRLPPSLRFLFSKITFIILTKETNWNQRCSELKTLRLHN